MTNDDDRRAAWGFRPECYTGEDKAGWLAGAYDCIRIIQAFTAHRIAAERRGIERAAQACENERLSEPQDEADAAYDHAIDRCIDAIRSLTEGTDK